MANMYGRKMEDRISLLPDSILHCILSSLNTKLVVQTCVLSKRWKTLWTRIPTLNFDFNSYPFTETSTSSRNAYQLKETSFKHFIFRMLSEHNGRRIKKLSYSSSESEGNVTLVELLICYARSHNVRELWIDTFSIDDYDWKHCLSAYSSLTVLKIVFGFVDDWGALALPLLRVLEIECQWEAQYYEDDYIGIRMFSGCPNLESLVLINYLFESATICAPNLENLELCCGYELKFPEVELMCSSSLKRVTFRNLLPTVKSSSEFSCIHKVNIEVSEFQLERASKSQKPQAKFGELLRVFHNATCFTLPLKATKVFFSAPFYSNGLSFHNMTHLELKSSKRNKRIDLPISELAYILKRPNLKTLAVVYEDNNDKTLRSYKW